MSLLQIRRNYQITLPAKLRQVLGLNVGDLVQAELLDNQAIVLKPKETVSKIRDFTAEEIDVWLEDDRLDAKTLKKAKKMIGVG